MSDDTLIVGVDSYVDVAEADAYVTAHFVSQAEERLAWEGFNEADKAVMLRAGAQAIESVRWTGKKLNETQALSFPRIKTTTFQSPYFTKSYAQSNEQDVKAAQIEEAVARACPSEGTLRKDRLNEGMLYSAIGSMQERYGEIQSAGGVYLASVFESMRAAELMQKYVGSYEVS